MSEAKTVNVAAAIFYKDNKILAACRVDMITLAGSFLAERLRLERPEQACVEIQEELHCLACRRHSSMTVTYSYPT